MKIVNIRIDSRLIHGQVAAMWAGTLGVNRLMVVDDEVIKDSLMKQLLKMACPKSCKLSILDVDTATNNIKIAKYADDNIMVIVKSPATLVKMFDKGFPLKEVTVGNMNASKESRQVQKTVSVTPKDEEEFNYLHSKGIEFYLQMVPSNEKTGVYESLVGRKDVYMWK